MKERIMPSNLNKWSFTSYPLNVEYDNKRKNISAVISSGAERGDDALDDRNFVSEKSGSAQLNAVLVRCDRKVRRTDVLKHFSANGLRAADLDELCAFGCQYPEKQKEFDILAFGARQVGQSFYERLRREYGIPKGETMFLIFPIAPYWLAIPKLYSYKAYKWHKLGDENHVVRSIGLELIQVGTDPPFKEHCAFLAISEVDPKSSVAIARIS